MKDYISIDSYDRYNGGAPSPGKAAAALKLVQVRPLSSRRAMSN
jgi:hypothetical protein